MSEPFSLTVTDVFHIAGRVVATGRVDSGVVRASDPVVVMRGAERYAGVVQSVETFGRFLDVARAGESVGVALVGEAGEKVRAGDVLATPSAAASDQSGPPPPAQPRIAAAPRRDPRFSKGEAELRRMRELLDAGRLTPDQLDAALVELRFEHAGRWWMIGANSGTWYASDGDRWVVAEPPVEG